MRSISGTNAQPDIKSKKESKLPSQGIQKNNNGAYSVTNCGETLARLGETGYFLAEQKLPQFIHYEMDNVNSPINLLHLICDLK